MSFVVLGEVCGSSKRLSRARKRLSRMRSVDTEKGEHGARADPHHDPSLGFMETHRRRGIIVLKDCGLSLGPKLSGRQGLRCWDTMLHRARVGWKRRPILAGPPSMGVLLAAIRWIEVEVVPEER